jgi:hypothetical protein
VLKGLKGPKDRKAHKVFKEDRVLRDHKVHKVM